MPSPLVEIKDGSGAYQPQANGFNATPGDTITIHLIDSSADSWSIACISTDDRSDKATINAALTIDPIGKTASFTYPNFTGRALRFQSQVNQGIGPDGKARSSYATTFAIYSLTADGRRVLAADETTESNSTFGYIAPLNDIIRNPAVGGGSTVADDIAKHAGANIDRVRGLRGVPIAGSDGDVPPIGGTQVYNAQGTASYKQKNPTYPGCVDVKDFGAVADWNGTVGTDNLAAFLAALAYLKARAIGVGSNFTGKLIADGHFYLSGTLDVHQSVLIQGSGRAPDVTSFSTQSGPGTMLVFPTDCDGVFFHGDAGIAYNSAIRDATVYCKDGPSRPGGGGGTNGGYPPNGHTGNGIRIQCPVIVDNCAVFFFAEDGIRGEGGSGFPGGIEGTSLTNCLVGQSGRHGYAFFGNDGHVNVIQTCNATKNYGYGFYDDSGVGNCWIACLAQENSGVIAGAGGFVADAVNHDFGTGPTFVGFNQALFLFCYTEGAPPNNDIGFPAGAFGGTLGDPTAFTPGSGGFNISSNGVTGTTPIKWYKARSADAVAAYWGDDDEDIAWTVQAPFGGSNFTPCLLRKYKVGPGYKVDGWWSLDRYDATALGTASVIRIPSGASIGTAGDRSYKHAPWMPHGVLLGNGDGFAGAVQHMQIASTAPTQDSDRNTGFTYEVGDLVWNTGTPRTNIGWVCTVAGTSSNLDVLSGITGTTDGVTAAVTLNSAVGVYVGCYIDIATATGGPFKVTSLVGLVAGLSAIPSAVSGQVVSYAPPTFGVFDGAQSGTSRSVDLSGGDVTLAVADDYVTVTVNGAHSVKLVASPVDGKWVSIKAGGAFMVTIDGNGHNIDGSATFTQAANRDCTLLRYNAATTEWEIR